VCFILFPGPVTIFLSQFIKASNWIQVGRNQRFRFQRTEPEPSPGFKNWQNWNQQLAGSGIESGWNQGGWFDLYMYTKTWTRDRFQVGEKAGTRPDFWNSVLALNLGLGLEHPLVSTFDHYGCPAAYFANCFLLVHYSFFFSKQSSNKVFLFQVLKLKE
jgi:hypothetical protein